MFKPLISILLINLATANPIAPDCITNYTTFYNQYCNETISNIYKTLDDISGTDCGKECTKLTNCTSFNYFPNFLNSNSKCELITSSFNSNNLLNDRNVGFYLKSQNDCSVSKEKNLVILIILSILVLVALSGIVCCCCRKNRSYNRIN